MSTLGDRIRIKRISSKYSQDELADAVGVNRVTLSKYERGIIEPSASILKRIAEKLNCTTSFLVGESQSAPSRPPITDADIKFALFGGDQEISDEQFEEVKRYALYLKERASR